MRQLIQLRRAPSEDELKERPIFSGETGPSGNLPERAFKLQTGDFVLRASATGPGDSFLELKAAFPDRVREWLGSISWQQSSPHACGRAISLYEFDHNAGARKGEPIADCFALLALERTAVLCLCDGVSWGQKPCNAARAAVCGMVHHMHGVLRELTGTAAVDSSVLFRHMLDSLAAAQELIVSCNATLTTASSVLAVPLAPPALHRDPLSRLMAKTAGLFGASRSATTAETPPQYLLLSLVVGDSPSFIYRHRSGTVQELSWQAHRHSPRDARVVPGVLGFANDRDPDLANLTCSATVAEAGDVVYLTSDGVSDNFDPVVLREAVLDRGWGSRHGRDACDRPLTYLTPSACHERILTGMAETIAAAAANVPGSKPCPGAGPGATANIIGAKPSPRASLGDTAGAKAVDPAGQHTDGPGGTGRVWAGGRGATVVVDALLAAVTAATEDHRKLLEEMTAAGFDFTRGNGGPAANTAANEALKRRLDNMPGKLDHASVVAYQLPH